MHLKSSVIYNLSIVLVGNFNPSIISPAWLALKKLIRESEAENSTIKITHPEVSHFELTFVDVQVTKDKCIFNCENEADFEITRDLAVSVFSVLKETPISGIGLNHTRHFGFDSADVYNNFGNWLAPHDIWKEGLRNPKLLEIKVIEPFEEGNPVKNLVTITTSDKIKNHGVAFLVNYHIETNRSPKKYPFELIVNHWDSSVNKSKSLFNSVIDKFNG